MVVGDHLPHPSPLGSPVEEYDASSSEPRSPLHARAASVSRREGLTSWTRRARKWRLAGLPRLTRLAIRFAFPERSLGSYGDRRPRLLHLAPASLRFRALDAVRSIARTVLANGFQRDALVGATFLTALLLSFDSTRDKSLESVGRSLTANEIGRAVALVSDGDDDDDESEGAVPRRLKELKELLARRAHPSEPSNAQRSRFRQEVDETWAALAAEHFQGDARGQPPRRRDVSPPATPGPIFSGITGTQGPTRRRGGGSSPWPGAPAGARGRRARWLRRARSEVTSPARAACDQGRAMRKPFSRTKCSERSVSLSAMT